MRVESNCGEKNIKNKELSNSLTMEVNKESVSAPHLIDMHPRHKLKVLVKI